MGMHATVIFVEWQHVWPCIIYYIMMDGIADWSWRLMPNWIKDLPSTITVHGQISMHGLLNISHLTILGRYLPV